MARLSFRCDQSLVERVDRKRGLIPREPWLRLAIEAALASEELLVDNRHVKSGAVEQALSEAKESPYPIQADPGSVPSAEGVRSAAPAEPSRVPDRPLSSVVRPARSFVKRGSGPIPK